jgi:hypothetical protein
MEMSFDRVLGIAGVVLAVLGIAIGVGVAIAMDPKSKGEMMFSIGCFIFSGLVLCFTVGIWSFLTSTPALKRLAISTLLFSVVCISTVEANRWVDSRYRRTEKNPEEMKLPPGEESHSAADSPDAKSESHVPTDHPGVKVERPSESPRPAPPTINPEIINALILQMTGLANDLFKFAAKCQTIEDDLPAVDKSIPLGIGKQKYKDNLPAKQWDDYHVKVKWEFKSGQHSFANTCRRILDSLPSGFTNDDVKELRGTCGGSYDDYPSDAESIKILSVLLLNLAREVQQFAQDAVVGSQNVVGNTVTQGPGGISQIGNGDTVVVPAKKSPEEKTPGELLSQGFHEKITHYTFTLGEHGISVSTTVDELRRGHKPFVGFPITVFLKEKDDTVHFNIALPTGIVGTPVVVNDSGEFSVSEPFWDRNYDTHAFEVVNDKQEAVLQVIRKTPSNLIINGIFKYQDGTVIADDKGWRPMKPGDSITRLFKYPSWKFPGVLADTR